MSTRFNSDPLSSVRELSNRDLKNLYQGARLIDSVMDGLLCQPRFDFGTAVRGRLEVLQEGLEAEAEQAAEEAVTRGRAGLADEDIWDMLLQHAVYAPDFRSELVALIAKEKA
ncbi:MAG: hypothetical protein R8L07_03405 [Alphaproteobacteria bacterium]|nr:hypothetical protein [Alphaproteobacteria bacterium]